MGAHHSNVKRQQENVCATPPKRNQAFLYDPRSPNETISRTPIQITTTTTKLYNHVASPIVGPDLPPIVDENDENLTENDQKIDYIDNETKRTSGVEPTLDPTTVLTALVANNNGQLPPYQL